MTHSRRSTISNARLEAMVEEATVDCYNEEEQILDLPLPTPPPAGTDWIEAYRHRLG